MDIIFEINRRFLAGVFAEQKEKSDLVSRVSLIAEGTEQRVRMANLAIVGSHTVNGVAELHSRILKAHLFKDFDTIFSPAPHQCHQRHHPQALAGPGQSEAGGIDQ